MMTIANIVKSILICIIVTATMLVNVDDNLLARLGIAENYLLLSLGVMLITLLTTGINTFVTAFIILFSMNANMPVEFSLNFGVDRDIYAIAMSMLLISAFSWTLVTRGRSQKADQREQLSEENPVGIVAGS